MSVPIAVTGAVPTTRIRSGVMSDAPPIPVMPTSAPMPRPSAMTTGSITERWPPFEVLDRVGRKAAGGRVADRNPGGASALRPDLGVREHRLEAPGKLLRGEIGQADALEDRPEVRPHSHPHVAQPLGRPGVVELLGGGLV